MKTAISVPDHTFERVERWVQELGMSRSEFYSRAASRYLDELEAGSVTKRIDIALADLHGVVDESWTDAVEAGRHVIGDDDQW